jgi:hypothetical protein
MEMEKRTVAQAVFDSLEALRIARQAVLESEEALNRTPRHLLDPSNPNHPNHDGIFGYDRDEFMAKQYRQGA